MQLVLPYGIADRFPDCYEVCKEISPFASSVREGRPLRVAIHVRRGELFVIDSQRMLPNVYYINVAQHTRSASHRLPNRTSHGGAQQGIYCSAGSSWYLQSNQRPHSCQPEMCRLDEFSLLPNLVRCIKEKAIDCLRELITADVLVMSRSSFSYVRGILNRNGIVLYHPFWHRAPSSWMTVGPDGQFDQLKFSKAVQTA